MDALKGGCAVANAADSGDAAVRNITFLVLYKRYAVMIGTDWVVRTHDLFTKKLLEESLHVQEMLKETPPPTGIPVLGVDDTAEMERLSKLHHPFVVDGRYGNWRCWEWDLDLLCAAPYGACEVHVSFGRCKKDDKTEAMPLRDFIDSFEALSAAAEAKGAAPPYLRAWHFAGDEVAKALCADYEVPAFAADFFDKMKDPADRPEFKWLFVGPRGVRTPLHVDPALTDAWMAQIQGHKRWKFVPPQDVHHLLDAHGFAQLDAIDANRFPTAHTAQILEVDVHPGQLVFIPQGWAHDVTTLSHSVALTHNYIDATAFKRVVRQAMLRQCLAPRPQAASAPAAG